MSVQVVIYNNLLHNLLQLPIGTLNDTFIFLILDFQTSIYERELYLDLEFVYLLLII